VPSSKPKPKVIITRKLPDAVETRMMELFNARLNIDDHPLSPGELMAAVAESDVLVPTVTDTIDAAVLDAAGPNLKLIANFGTGINHIDLGAAKAKGITVTNTPGVLTEDTADLTMALILAAPRRISEGERLLRSGQWKGWAPTLLLGHRIAGQRLGIIGMGRIGQAVARRAKGFGLAIHYHNRHRVPEATEQELEATYWEDLDQMLIHVDIVSVNCPLTDATRNLLSAERLALLQPHVVVVNTARGEIFDENALADALEAGKIGGAGLDVYAGAPDVNPRLLALENAVLTPHMGSATIAGRIAMGEKVIINIRSFVDGNPAPDRVIEGVTT
jgi:glyoxylate reductase